MKRTISICIVVLMLLLMVFPIIPQNVSNVSAKSPEDYLNAEEKAYVAAIRSADAAARAQIASMTVQLWGYQPNQNWYDTVDVTGKNVTAAVSSLAIDGPAEFTDIAAEYKSIPVSPAIARYTKVFGLTVTENDLTAFVIVLDMTESELNSLEGDLDRMIGKVNAKVADIAKRQELGEKLLSGLFDSCSSPSK